MVSPEERTEERPCPSGPGVRVCLLRSSANRAPFSPATSGSAESGQRGGLPVNASGCACIDILNHPHHHLHHRQGGGDFAEEEEEEEGKQARTEHKRFRGWVSQKEAARSTQLFPQPAGVGCCYCSPPQLSAARSSWGGCGKRGCVFPPPDALRSQPHHLSSGGYSFLASPSSLAKRQSQASGAP